MLHEPAAQSGKDPAFGYKRKLGAMLFGVYALVYCVFIALNVIDPKGMAAPVFAGLDLAVVYGFGLIVFALLLALVYSVACTAKERALEGGD